jgi:hypothetical protein
MAWTNSPLTLYHGTTGAAARDILANGPNLAWSIAKRDFGVGFYTSKDIYQAITFANDKYKIMRVLRAVVLEFVVDRNSLGRLTSISFALANDEWREFVRHCRAPGAHRPDGSYYQTAHGPVSTNTLDAWPDYEQLSFHHRDAILVLGQAREVRRGRPTIP